MDLSLKNRFGSRRRKKRKGPVPLLSQSTSKSRAVPVTPRARVGSRHCSILVKQWHYRQIRDQSNSFFLPGWKVADRKTQDIVLEEGFKLYDVDLF
jgi:hypothetical protein